MPTPTLSPRRRRGSRAPAAVAAVTVLVAFALLLAANAPAGAADAPAGSGASGGRPYAPSAAVGGIRLDWSTFRRDAPGSDNFPMTWAGDGSVYTSWGDGAGFGAGAKGAKGGYTSIGVARLTGSSARTLRGENLFGGLRPSVGPCVPRLGGLSDDRPFARGGTSCGADALHGKSYSILALDGELSMFVTPGSGTKGYDEARIYQTTIGADRWRRADWAFTKGGRERLLSPAFLQAGPDYRDGGDYVYAYAARYAPRSKDGLAIQGAGAAGGEIALMRAPRGADLMSRSAWSFFAGLDGGGAPRWSGDPGAIRPVVADRNGVGWTTSAIYNAPLKRYLLTTQNGKHASSRMTLLEAPTPWGPWRTVAYRTLDDPQRRERRGFYYNFVPNSFSADGRRFTLAMTGRDHDSLLLVDGELLAKGPGASPGEGAAPVEPSPVDAGALLAEAVGLGRRVRERREQEAAAGLALGRAALAQDQRLGFAAFPVGVPAAGAAGDGGGAGGLSDEAGAAGAGDPTRAHFARVREAEAADGDGGVALTHALGERTTLGLVLSEYDDDTKGAAAAAEGGLAVAGAADAAALASRGVSLHLGHRLRGGLALDTRLAYSLDTYAWDARGSGGDGGRGRAAFDGRTAELSQRVGYPVRLRGLALTPWGELAYETQRIDRFTLESAYLPERAFAGSEVGDASASLGLDAELEPVPLGGSATLALRAGVSYTRGLASDDYRVRTDAAGFGAREETIERPEARTLGLTLGGSLSFGGGVVVGADLSAQDDPETGPAQTARMDFSWRF